MTAKTVLPEGVLISAIYSRFRLQVFVFAILAIVV